MPLIPPQSSGGARGGRIPSGHFIYECNNTTPFTRGGTRCGCPQFPPARGYFRFPPARGGVRGVSKLAAAPAAGAPYFVANEGQWQVDFQFKCEVGSTTYYVTPQGMTIDLRSFVGADGNPPAQGNFDPFAERGFSEVLEKHAAVPRRNPQVRGHVIQIHYWSPPASGGIKGGRPAIGTNKLPHYSNYFLGRDSTRRHPA